MYIGTVCFCTWVGTLLDRAIVISLIATLLAHAAAVKQFTKMTNEHMEFTIAHDQSTGCYNWTCQSAWNASISSTFHSSLPALRHYLQSTNYVIAKYHYSVQLPKLLQNPQTITLYSPHYLTRARIRRSCCLHQLCTYVTGWGVYSTCALHA